MSAAAGTLYIAYKNKEETKRMSKAINTDDGKGTPFDIMHLQWFAGDPGDTGDNQDGSTDTLPAWMSQLPDELKQNEQLSQFKNLGELGNKFLEVSKNAEGSFKIPGEGATDEEISAFYNKIGRPKEASAYDLQSPQLPEGMQMNTELGVAFRDLSHKIGLTQKQAKQLFDFYNNHMITTFSTAQKAKIKAVTDAGDSLKQEWGTNFDTNMEVVKRAYVKFGNEDFTKFMNESGAGNNPVVIKTFFEIGKATLDDTIVDGDLTTSEKREKGVVHYDNSPGLYKK